MGVEQQLPLPIPTGKIYTTTAEAVEIKIPLPSNLPVTPALPPIITVQPFSADELSRQQSEAEAAKDRAKQHSP